MLGRFSCGLPVSIIWLNLVGVRTVLLHTGDVGEHVCSWEIYAEVCRDEVSCCYQLFSNNSAKKKNKKPRIEISKCGRVLTTDKSRWISVFRILLLFELFYGMIDFHKKEGGIIFQLHERAAGRWGSDSLLCVFPCFSGNVHLVG